MCRILFYTVDTARMQLWLDAASAAPFRAIGQRARSALWQAREDWEDWEDWKDWKDWEGAEETGTDTSFLFLSDPSRERSLVSWARGVVRYPPYSTCPAGPVHPRCPGCPGCAAHHASPELSPCACPAGWLPPREALTLHSTIAPDAYECLLERGALSRDGGTGESAPRPAERAFLDELRPLLGIWYGRLVFIRSPDQPCLVAQVNARAWIEGRASGLCSVETGSGSYSAESPLLLEYPPAWAVLSRNCPVVEMFGAEHADLCCCSLVESTHQDNIALRDLESTFLDALGLMLLGSPEGTVLLDIDADYAEA